VAAAPCRYVLRLAVALSASTVGAFVASRVLELSLTTTIPLPQMTNRMMLPAAHPAVAERVARGLDDMSVKVMATIWERSVSATRRRARA